VTDEPKLSIADEEPDDKSAELPDVKESKVEDKEEEEG
jgi:hypothetical protein